jgi:hypothetical protein
MTDYVAWNRICHCRKGSGVLCDVCLARKARGRKGDTEMTDTKPDEKPTEIGAVLLEEYGELAVVHVHEGRVEIPIYEPDLDDDDDELRHKDDTEHVLVMGPDEARDFALLLTQASKHVGKRGRRLDGWGFLDDAVDAAEELIALSNGVMTPATLQAATHRLGDAVTAWREVLDAELGPERPEHPQPPEHR